MFFASHNAETSREATNMRSFFHSSITSERSKGHLAFLTVHEEPVGEAAEILLAHIPSVLSTSLSASDPATPLPVHLGNAPTHA
jgi:hypothetical protein